jgi:hypothetical protein
MIQNAVVMYEIGQKSNVTDNAGASQTNVISSLYVKSDKGGVTCSGL